MTKAVCAAESVDKPKGVYASVVTGRAVTNKLMRGGLIRIPWAELEPSPGIFNFTLIEERLELLPEGMNWTLAVHGGWTSKEGGQADVLNPKGVVSRPGKPGGALARTALSPPWLVTEFKVKTFSMSFRGKPVQMPLYWDPVVQERLKSMLQALGEKYASDSRLKLVYVPQMSSNGTEGHFNGVSRETLLLAAGIDPDKKDAENLFADLWVAAGCETTRSVMEAFPRQAVAFEVHEIFRSTRIPEGLMKAFQDDPVYEGRVGLGMWWISGKTSYQPELVEMLKKYDGDLYGQVIGRSDQTDRFEKGDYATVFSQARELGMRYIEPWNYEFEKHTHDDLMEAFNRYCDETYP